MNKLLLTTALGLALSAGGAQAQSVLERVLSTIDGNTNMEKVNGVFANIAENIGTTAGGTVWTDADDAVVTVAEMEAAYDAALATAVTTAQGNVTYTDTNGADVGGDKWVYDGVNYDTEALADAAAAADATADFADFGDWATTAGYTSSFVEPLTMMTAIDGSITNTLTGVTTATADVGGTVIALDQVTVDLGDMATTVLGAVNTGEITLGVNQDVSEAIAGSSSAVSAAIEQLGGSVDSAALVLNVASNATDIIGSVNTTMTGLNGSMGDVATTVLGAVNTGTITSGVNAAVNGIQSGIVGTN
ncbi:hypothetical protein [Tabrizicola soli]|uniref:Uncharacterized protein n=1 Tax=Tabrizicola soli TaxID=2185115 RepID=A0ABV7DUM2_9RHOB|nr:hypothetical protein [Tabrizicola soli]